MYIYRMEERVEMWNEKKEGKNISTKMEKKIYMNIKML